MVNNLFAGENFCTTFPINAKRSPCQSDWYKSSNWRWMTERFGLGGCLNFPGPGRLTSHKPNPPKSFQIIVTPLPSNAAATQIQNCPAQEIQSPMMNENTIYETIEIQMIVVEWSKRPPGHKSEWLCRGNTIFASEEIERRRHIEIPFCTEKSDFHWHPKDRAG